MKKAPAAPVTTGRCFVLILLSSSAVFVERRIAGVEVLGIEIILGYAECFTKALEMDYLAFTQEADRVAYIGVVCEADYIVIGRACLLFGSHVFVQIGDDIALGLEICRGEGDSRCGNRVDAGGVVNKIGVEAALLYLFHSHALG